SSHITVHCRDILSYAVQQLRGGSPAPPVTVGSHRIQRQECMKSKNILPVLLCSSSNWAMAPVPVNDLCTSGGPYALVVQYMGQRRVQVAAAERLAHEPGVQVQHQQPPVCSRLVIQRIEGLLDHLPVPVDINAPVPEGIDVIQRQRDGQGVQLTLGDF